MNGRTRVNTRIQLSASRPGASSASGKEGWFLRTFRREVIARMSVSRFSMEASRVRLISAGEKRLKTSSTDSGSSQNCNACQYLIDPREMFPRRNGAIHLSSIGRLLEWLVLQTNERSLA